jgi:undecaprenyl-diphosphatase
MNLLDSAILGVVEGITEFLPISSTGHLILASSLLGLPSTEFLKTFEIAIQLGAILAVLALYWKRFLDLAVLKKVAVAFVPTAVIGLALHDLAKEHLLGNQAVVLWALGLGGVLLIAFELLHKEQESASADLASISYKQAALVGVFQAVAIVPGVSRSAATILGGLLVGIRRMAIVEFSFLLAAPVMMAATGLDLAKSASLFSAGDFGNLAVGFVVSFVVALFSIRFLLKFVRTHTFIPFGVYRILVALILFFALFA